MTILRFSAFSLPLAVSIISLGFTNPAFAAKPDCNSDPSHPSCDDGGGADGITYTAELRGALVFAPLSVVLEGQDERLKSGDPVTIVRPTTGVELTAWNFVFTRSFKGLRRHLRTGYPEGFKSFFRSFGIYPGRYR